MPFVITTKRMGTDPTRKYGGAPVVSRRAVATLEDRRIDGKLEAGAWRVVHDLVAMAEHATSATMDGRFDALYDQAHALGESGGTVGPLPGGTTIQVEPIWWADLREQAGLDRDGFTLDADTLAAWNARHGQKAEET